MRALKLQNGEWFIVLREMKLIVEYFMFFVKNDSTID